MKDRKSKPGGWLDWMVVVSIVAFVLLMLCSLYLDAKYLKAIAFIPALFAVWKTFSDRLD